MFFIGHRDADPAILPILKATIECYITVHGVREFIVGQYGNFDAMVASTLVDLKRVYPYITLRRLLAYHPAERSLQLQQGFDSFLYPPDMERVPRRFAIKSANRYMIEHTSHCIAYVTRTVGNAYDFLQYAQRQIGMTVINIADMAGDT